MLPYFQQPSVSLGPITIHLFGVLTAVGVFVAARIAARQARAYSSLDPAPLERAIPWALIGGFIGGHLLHVLGYHPELIKDQGLIVLLKLWDGQSSMGGLLGGVVGFVIAFWRARTPFLPYLDALALGVAPGWAIARIGCFFAHDHPGSLTNFPLAVAFPQGARHDLGLYDAIVLGIITLVLYGVRRTKPRSGTLISILAITYGAPRFFLDFLRARDLAFVDGRILGLTPAQYVALLLITFGITSIVLRAQLSNKRAKATRKINTEIA